VAQKVVLVCSARFLGTPFDESIIVVFDERKLRPRSRIKTRGRCQDKCTTVHTQRREEQKTIIDIPGTTEKTKYMREPLCYTSSIV
jgi:hypothetical protein